MQQILREQNCGLLQVLVDRKIMISIDLISPQKPGIQTLNGSEGFRPRSVAGHCTFDDKILIFGGEVDPSGLGHDGAGSFACDTVLWDCKTYTFS